MAAIDNHVAQGEEREVEHETTELRNLETLSKLIESAPGQGANGCLIDTHRLGGHVVKIKRGTTIDIRIPIGTKSTNGAKSIAIWTHNTDPVLGRCNKPSHQGESVITAFDILNHAGRLNIQARSGPGWEKPHYLITGDADAIRIRFNCTTRCHAKTSLEFLECQTDDVTTEITTIPIQVLSRLRPRRNKEDLISKDSENQDLIDWEEDNDFWESLIREALS